MHFLIGLSFVSPTNLLVTLDNLGSYDCCVDANSGILHMVGVASNHTIDERDRHSYSKHFVVLVLVLVVSTPISSSSLAISRTYVIWVCCIFIIFCCSSLCYQRDVCNAFIIYKRKGMISFIISIKGLFLLLDGEIYWVVTKICFDIF